MLVVPDRYGGMVVYSIVSGRALGCVMMQHKPLITYFLKKLKLHEKNNPIDLKLVTLIFALKIWRRLFVRESSEGLYRSREFEVRLY